MKFEFVAKVDSPVMSYGEMVSTGDVVEFEGWFAQKAKANPNWRLVESATSEESAPDAPVVDDLASLDSLRAQWKAKFGKAPHHKKPAKTLREELNGD